MQYMLLRLVFITLKKMDFSKGINYQLATLFGIGKLPGGGTWSSLMILLIALAENSAETASFIAFFSLIIAPRAYKKLVNELQNEDPKEFVLDEVIGMGIALGLVNAFIYFFSNNANFDTQFFNKNNIFIITFIIFRFFDISKVGPVGWIENNKNETPYIRVIGDDIAAALLSALIIIIFFNLWAL